LVGVPADVTVECDEIPNQATPTATDNCDTDVEITLVEDIASGGDCDGELLITRTWTATDNCGNTDTQTQIIITFDNTAPVFADVPADLTINCEDTLPTDAPMATDNCDPNPVIVLDEQTTPGACPQEEIITRTWTATDACGNAEVVTQTITIEDNEDPVLANISADVTIDCTDALPTDAPTATDNCDTDVTITLNETTAAGACPQEEVITREWTATDDCGNASTGTQIITIEDNDAPTFANVPADVTINCEDALPTDEPTISDNCDINPTLTVADTEVAGNCEDERTITRVWTATDACGNAATVSQIIEIQDITNPELVNVPADISVECDAIPNPPTDVTATDNCDTNVEIQYSESPQPGFCPGAFTIVRTWVATDNCGNTVIATQEVFIQDTEAPVITGVPANVDVECDEIPDVPLPGDVVATDNCDPNPFLEFEETTAPGVCDNQEVITRTWTTTDWCGNVSTEIQTITVGDSQPPVIANLPADISAECDAIPAIDTNVTATDNCDANSTIEVVETTTPGSCPEEYSLFRTWTATDNCGNTSTATQTIFVFDITAPILANVPADTNADCDNVPAPATPTATDNCDTDVEITMDETINDDGCNATIFRTWTATDNCGNASTASQTISVTDNDDPILAGIPADISAECDAIPAADTNVTATDNCDSDVDLEMVETTTSGSCPEEYALMRTWTATDNCGNTATATQTIFVFDATAPILANVPADSNEECDAIPPVPTNITATDNCDIDVQVDFAEVIADNACGQTITRTWTATDNCGNQDIQTQIINVGDSAPPVITGVPADISAECDEIPNVPNNIVVTDNCDDDITLELTETTTPGSCPEEYALIRTWSATDDCGNTTTQSQTIFVFDITAPILANVPADINADCNTIPPVPADVTATDNCDTDVLVELNEVIVDNPCGQTITRTWTATDNCGNQTTDSQVISVGDTDAPVFDQIVADITVECDAVPTADVLTVLDNCDSDINIVFDEVQTPGICEDAYTLTRTWEATDDCGNTTQTQQIVTVEDTTDPILAGIPADISAECDAIPAIDTNITATDNCDNDVEIEVVETTTPGSCPEEYSLFRTWTATDNCGNETTATQTILVFDITAPILADVPVDTNADCDNIPTAATPTATDNCDTDVEITFAETIDDDGCNAVITRTWTATDNCGNQDVQTQIINVTDKM